MSGCWMQIGVFVQATGCGYLALHLKSFYLAQIVSAPLSMVRGWIRPENL